MIEHMEFTDPYTLRGWSRKPNVKSCPKEPATGYCKECYVSVYEEEEKKSNNFVEQPQGTCILSHCHNKDIATGKRIHSVTAQTCTISRHQCKAGEATGLKMEV